MKTEKKGKLVSVLDTKEIDALMLRGVCFDQSNEYVYISGDNSANISIVSVQEKKVIRKI